MSDFYYMRRQGTKHRFRGKEATADILLNPSSIVTGLLSGLAELCAMHFANPDNPLSTRVFPGDLHLPHT